MELEIHWSTAQRFTRWYAVDQKHRTRVRAVPFVPPDRDWLRRETLATAQRLDLPSGRWTLRFGATRRAGDTTIERWWLIRHSGE